MVGWHHQLNGHEFEQGPRVSDRQGSLACCSPWGCRATSQRSNWTELNWGSLRRCSLPTMNSFYNLNRLTFLRMGSPSARYGKWIWQRDELIILIFFGLEYSGGASGKEPACQCRRQLTRVRSQGWVDPLKEEMAPHFSILAWRIWWAEEPGGLQSIGLQRVRHDRSDLACIHHGVTAVSDAV